MAVIDKGAAVIDNKEGLVLEETSAEDNVKVAADPDPSERKESEHDSEVLLAEQRSSHEQERNEDTVAKIQEKNIKIFAQEIKMDYLKLEEMLENGKVVELTDNHRVDDKGSPRTFHVNPYEAAYEARERIGLPYELNHGASEYAAFAASYASKYKKGSTKEYWKGNAPVLKKCDYNRESVMLPKIAPRDEPQVTVQKVILDRTFSTIKNHQGGTKVNYADVE